MLSELLRIKDLLESPKVGGEAVARYLSDLGATVTVVPLGSDDGRLDFVRAVIPGSEGRSSGGSAPTIGLIGRLGGISARGDVGFVSDADGALIALTVAAKLARLRQFEQLLRGDVVIATNITRAGAMAGQFMTSPVDMLEVSRLEVLPEMAAIISIDATKANRVVNRTGLAITPTVKEGWVLRVSESLLTLVERVTGEAATVLPITTQDITRMDNGVYHINSIMQPSLFTSAPVVGLATTSRVLIPGSATGVTNAPLLDSAARLCFEIVKHFTAGKLDLFDANEFQILTRLYGSLRMLQAEAKVAVD